MPDLSITFNAPDQKSCDISLLVKDGATCDEMIDLLRSQIEVAAQSAAARLNCEPDDLVVDRLGLAGKQHRFLAEGTYSDGGNWLDHVQAVNEEDAELGMRFTMACNQGADPDVAEFEWFCDSMESIGVISIEEEPVTKSEYRDALASVVRDVLASGGSSESLHQAMRLLELGGQPVQPPSSPAPLRAFFKGSDLVLGFVNEHSTGDEPWVVVLDHGDRIVVAHETTETFFAIRSTSHGYEASLFTSVVELLDPDGSKDVDLGTHASPEAAFSSVLDHAGLSVSGPLP